MRVIKYQEIAERIREMCLDANYNLPRDVLQALQDARTAEESSLGRSVLDTILENADIAGQKRMALCQDTGIVVVFAEVGKDV